MSITFIFWFLMLFGLLGLLGWGWARPWAAGGWGWGPGFLVWILLGCLAWKVFGFPIHG